MRTSDSRTEPVRIRICMGSSCFSRGNRRNLDVIRTFINDNGLNGRVEVVGSLCVGECGNGPNIAINDIRFSNVDANVCLDLLRQHVDISDA